MQRQTKPISSWAEQANCSGQTYLFFGKQKENVGDRRKREASAKQLCSECDVREECRDYARKNNELGLWGGETEEERIDGGHLRHSALKRKIDLRLKNLNQR
jgi:WhiB family redox-sensing transcriptional regulator